MADSRVGDKLFPLLSVALLTLLAAAAVSIFLSQRAGQGAENIKQSLLQRQALAASMAGEASAAARGNADASQRLAGLLNRARNVAPFPGASQEQYAAVETAWNELRADAAALLQAQESVAIVQRSSASVGEALPVLLTELGNLAALPGLSALIGEVQRFEISAQRLQQDVFALASGLGDPPAIAARIARTNDYLSQFVRALSQGDASLGIEPVADPNASPRLAQIEAVYATIDTAVRDSVVSVDGLTAVRQRADEIVASADTVVDTTVQQHTALSARPSGALWTMLPLVAIGLAALMFVAIMSLFRKAAGAQRAARYEAEQNTRNQDAILRLLDELGSLADGDLTAQATVSEDITGAIADSINYAIEALRDLVTTIDEAASQVDEAARQTRASASHLAQASENQSQQVQAATESIADMASSIEEVSHNAERSAEVSRHSVEIAHKGGEAVRRTIDGMNTIRETIQETSKRIKRLGESSQEIGNIVELINDIAEQTNILALNASIQASMAGEAGRGFAVVADEVQRLAERSANATKQIEVLVNTIQSDTNEAVVSMERSTTDVVSGALLAENAGGALDEIEKVSNQIAGLVQNISASARTQATAAADVTRNMGVLQEISSQTAEGSNATSTAIGKLAEMSTELRRSVAGFTLPEKEAPAVPGVLPRPRIAAERSPEAANS